MGAYLSKPKTDKISTDETGDRVICGASSMQGWRVTQEDAHNCTLDYDTETSFFAVYDGHGGHEVAAYSAQHLPEYLKNCEAYKKGDYTQALKDAFLEFDATLAKPEVVTILKQIASSKDGEPNSESDVEEENVRNLYEEAEMPLEQVMAKYHNDLLSTAKKLKQEDGKPPVSPFLRGRRSCTLGASSSGAGSSSSSGAGSSKSSGHHISEPGNGSADSDEDEKKERDTEVSSSSSQAQNSSISESSSSSTQNQGINEVDHTSDSSASNGETKPNEEGEAKINKETVPDSSGDAKVNNIDKNADKAENENSVEKVGNSSDVKQEVNGETGEEKKTVKDSEGVACSAPRENGEVTEEESKGKGKMSSSVVEEKRSVSTRRRRFPPGTLSVAATYFSSLSKIDVDSDSDDEGDESFEGAENSSDDDDDDDEDGEEEEDEDDDGEEEAEGEDNEDGEDDDDEMVDDEEDDDFSVRATEKPGLDSGCTAVVALLKGQELYVANAGDSRCVVCRKGQAIEMSLDHKPEDDIEMARIEKAGGHVTMDGRVNGGLNLSRALGDHSYKKSEGLSAQEQMITALPDVRSLMIDPEEDEFMILACDGIWNFMSSQEAVDFIRPHIKNGQTKLSKICEELFDHCLAPNTFGDGTGCDNMTAVIVQFRPELANISESKSLKRAASPDSESNSETAKRSKTEENEATSV